MEECELLRQDELSNSIAIEGEFASEETMLETWGWSQWLGLTVSMFFEQPSQQW